MRRSGVTGVGKLRLLGLNFVEVVMTWTPSAICASGGTARILVGVTTSAGYGE
jgi:hypothetical protein